MREKSSTNSWVSAPPTKSVFVAQPLDLAGDGHALAHDGVQVERGGAAPFVDSDRARAGRQRLRGHQVQGRPVGLRQREHLERGDRGLDRLVERVGDQAAGRHDHARR